MVIYGELTGSCSPTGGRWWFGLFFALNLVEEHTSNKEGNQATCIHNPPRVKDSDIIFTNTPATLNKQQCSLHVLTNIIFHSQNVSHQPLMLDAK